MTNRKITVLLAIGALALIAIIGTFTYRSVSAQAATPTAQAPEATKESKSGRLPGGKPGGFTQEELAAALGIDVTKLQAAYETANKAAIEQAVSQGIITQEQADQFLQNGSTGRRLFRLRGLEASGIDYEALLADALGISVEDLQAAKLQAFNTAIDNAVSSGTLTQEQADLLKGRYALSNSTKFQESMRSAFEAAVNQAVADGTLTQAQADQLLANPSGLPGFDGRGFGHRGGRHGGWAPDNSQSPSGSSPSPTPGGDL